MLVSINALEISPVRFKRSPDFPQNTFNLTTQEISLKYYQSFNWSGRSFAVNEISTKEKQSREGHSFNFFDKKGIL